MVIKFAVILAIIVVISIAEVLHAESVTLEWDPVADKDLAGYNVYYGSKSREYGPPIKVGTVTVHTIEDLVEGKAYFFAVQSVDLVGNKSIFSRELKDTLPNIPPGKVLRLRKKVK